MIKHQDGITTRAIVISRKKFKNYSLFTFITPRRGIVRCSIPHKWLQTLKNSSYLRPFSAVYITFLLDEEYVNLVQLDGVYSIEQVDKSLSNISYIAIISELINELFQLYDVNEQVFSVIANFSNTIRHKSIRLGTIVLGWQLFSLAGLTPSKEAFLARNGIDEFWDELRSLTGASITGLMKRGIEDMISYSWDSKGPLNISKYTWNDLESLLYLYSTIQLGHELQSVNFLRTMTIDKDINLGHQG